ncbi:hypothetical protein E3O06_07375 [Cryobacterium glaciale]|uniref:Uncharacterized protein n=1 Tax=Cryobacterium glaciale TaxID=1259145 RepID=A0A4R8UZL4_9MICO|nr:hypothetical protein [Cryobacterium glaciale]TFB74127.1 hypothetical protein E3O06_07375 [Cryobacterium glaciale]
MTDYKAPTEQQVREALRRIPTLHLRRAFFEGLKNPLWLEPLAKEGAFASPPIRVTLDDGSISDPSWPEIEYVVRVAAAAPTAAVDILLKLVDSENAWVRRAVFEIGGTVPAPEAARLKPLLKAWLSSGFGWRTDPRAMVDFVVNLIDGGQRKVGAWIANVLFRPGESTDSTKPNLVLEEYWYDAGLLRVVASLGGEGLPLVLGWLVEYERVSGQSDGWSFSRPNINARRDGYRKVEDALIDGVRDLALTRMTDHPAETASLLVRTNLMLARRIAMFANARSLSVAIPGSDAASALVAIAIELMFEPSANDERCRAEFAELARAVGKHSPAALEPLGDFIKSGPPLGNDELRTRLLRDSDETADEIEHKVGDYVEHWQHLWLASIGAEALPEYPRSLLATLDNRRGTLENPLRPPLQITTWTGPNSPLTHEEMAAMSPTALIAHLEGWHDTADGWGPEPSHEGQARALASLVTSNPASVDGGINLIERLRPTYLRAILSGWEAAFLANNSLDWPRVADVIEGVLTHDYLLDFPVEGGKFDDDRDYGWSKKAAVSLLGNLVGTTDTELVIPPRSLARFADLLIETSRDETAWLQYADGDHESGMDPLALSINWQWPIRLRGLVRLLTHGPEAPWHERTRSEIDRELGRTDTRGASRAVLGEALGRLLTSDEIWMRGLLPSIYGTDEGIDRNQQIALTTAMAIHHYHHKLYELLTPSMLAAMQLADPIVDGWRIDSDPLQRIGEWAVKSMIFGDTEWDDPVVTVFFGTADPTVRGAALGHVGWEFMHSNDVAEDICGRFAAIWDARLAHVERTIGDAPELREFHWVVKSGKFRPDWWLPRFQRMLELSPKVASERFMIGKEIAAASELDPRSALDIMKLLLSTNQARSMATYELSENVVAMVIAKAIESSDEALKRDASSFMNALGEAGHLGLAKQVDQVLAGEVTQRDVED